MSNGSKSMSDHGYHPKVEMRNALFLQLASLESNRQQLCSRINSLSSFNSLLPAEIKAAIFYKAVQLPCPLYDGEGDPVITPFFLGKICRDWRDLVWSSPLLWSNIRLCVTRRRCKAQANLLRDWLSRAASCPLSVCLTSGEEPEAWDYNPPVEILTIFVSISARWKQAELYIPDNQLWFDTISAAQNSLPLLTTATVEFESSSDERRPFRLFSTAPQLSALHLFQPWFIDVPAPWHQLREFTLTNSSVDEIRGFLHKASNIIHCSIRDIDSSTFNRASDLFSRPLALDRLEHIELRFEGRVNTASTLILGSVKLPSLREVFLHGSFIFTDAAILPRITESFSASSLLEKFTLSGILSSDRILIQALENIPSIKELHLKLDNPATENQLLTRELLQQLCPPHTNILLPNLRNFTFHGPTSLNDHMPLFHDMLVYRFRQCTSQPTGLCADSEQGVISQLQSVSIRSLRKLVIGQDIQDELDILVQEERIFDYLVKLRCNYWYSSVKKKVLSFCSWYHTTKKTNDRCFGAILENLKTQTPDLLRKAGKKLTGALSANGARILKSAQKRAHYLDKGLHLWGLYGKPCGQTVRGGFSGSRRAAPLASSTDVVLIAVDAVEQHNIK
ncbi:uncharacterized protein LACBIDRAFT_330902 [Laccaria bicolor S238N-H82]|uniref:Predicted protein n=1 Tax=Laccaria bicolor (strain S238N-H82 / ATCC MYA-4686) TaxID=486041 RepID=B0DN47_LACBS|nr:uncharacterized protein LACBIDRAFT_330902 [Laccaria bicolor S238N-H82]EDR04080.1 predicted protein [Laccaria bicolor S238N-H82]|eukprot:XP_001885335.1 predicted protein [Laccaria bicolor S238N-H82]